AAGREPRVTAGLRGGGRLARRGENRHGAFLREGAKIPADRLSCHQPARISGWLDLDRNLHPPTSPPRCGGACPEVSFTRYPPAEGEGWVRHSYPPRPAVGTTFVCAIEDQSGRNIR